MSASIPPSEGPEILPILPLRNSVLFPASVVPVNVGRARSVKLIEESFGLPDIMGIEALGKLRPDRREQIERLLRPSLVNPQRGKVGRGPKFERARILLPGDR